MMMIQLQSILENVLLDLMFQLPSMENVEKIVIDEGAITGDAEPLVIYKNPEVPEKQSEAS